MITAQEHKDIEAGKGLLAPLNKPNKIKGPVSHLRAVTLLSIIRKILENITQARTDDKIMRYLSHSHSAYISLRSTSDIVWSHRWLSSRIEVKNEKIYIIGIDMSAAFDTINRRKLLEILNTFLDDDEVRMIRFLLTNTSLKVKVQGAETLFFESNIGSPQGGSLSGKLFNVYFDDALNPVREFIDEISEVSKLLPPEAIYADDADFITMILERKERLKNNVKEILLRANLKVNESKTDETVLERKNKGERYSSKQSGDLKLTFTKEIEKWRNTKKLGSLIGVSEDIRRRKQLATAALVKMNNIWIRKDKIKQSLRLKLYKSLIKPILVYNAGTWSPTKKEEDELDSFHRRQLRKVMNVKYPVRMRNTVVYKEGK